ncbi:helix-turn-helix domain-containing protein [uncultured Blautia sp.]|uniref:helix-turn-helix domain-containing protein n=1 Tax=Blautia sp. HCP28S3_G10 TaxID=3438908 RepID=UPI0025CBBE62|nr:helix-turn-helix domain-containing protein [uncultured Blautia sp.]
MISYNPFWETIHQKDISTYQLIYEYGILPDTIQRLRSGKTITTKTLNTLCSVIGCQVSDILEFVPDDTSDNP